LPSFLTSIGAPQHGDSAIVHPPFLSLSEYPAPIVSRIPTLKRLITLLTSLVFRCAFDSRFPKLADRVRLGSLLDWVRFVFSLRFSLFVQCHSNHLLSYYLFVRSAFVHSQRWVEGTKVLLGIVHGAAEEACVGREGSKVGAIFTEPHGAFGSASSTLGIDRKRNL
jgi:hypothetical protein